MPNAPILAGSHTTFIMIALMCRAFKQSEFLLKFEMKNKGNVKKHLLPPVFMFVRIYIYIFAVLDI